MRYPLTTADDLREMIAEEQQRIDQLTAPARPVGTTEANERRQVALQQSQQRMRTLTSDLKETLAG